MHSPARHPRLDSIKLSLAVMVVAIHTGLANELPVPAGLWVRRALLDIAVPTFLVVQGYFLQRQVQQPAALRAWLGRMLAMYGLWALPLLYLQRAEPPLALAWTLAFGALGALWYLPAAALGGWVVWCLQRWLGRRAGWGVGAVFPGAALLGWAGLTLCAGEVLSWGIAAGWWPQVAPSEPAEAGLLRNALLCAAPGLALGAVLAMADAPGAALGRWRRGFWPAGLVLVGTALVWAEVALTFAWLDGGWYARHLMVGHPLVAAGLLGWGLNGAAGGALPWQATAPNVVYLAHMPMVALAWKLGVPGGWPMTVAAVAGSLLLTPLLLRLRRRWPWVV